MKKLIHKAFPRIMGTLLASFALIASISSVQAASTITATDNETACVPRTGSGHASTIMFFGSGIKNIIATTNEFQRQGGAAISQPTDLTFDVWKSNGTEKGTCIGQIVVKIDGGTNERAEIIVEEHLTTPASGYGVLVRTGQLDARSKLDAYIQTESEGKRRIIWNNFTGIPNNSRLMSGLRMASGQHLAIYFTGQDDRQAEANIQAFSNNGTFIGVATQSIGSHSSVITDDVMSLDYKDLDGNPVDASKLPKDGEGYLRILGRVDDEIEASCMILYSKAQPGVANGAWDNSKLASTTISFARRNGNNDPLTLGE